MAKINLNMDSLKSRQEIKRHKTAEGETLLRFLPPFGDEANGYPYKKWLVSWGLLDPQTGNKRPFASSFMFEDKCPIYEYIDLVKPQVDAEVKRLGNEGLTEEDIKENMKEVFNIISDLRPKKTFAWNAANKSGEVGIVELKATAQDQLKLLMDTYIKENNQDPTSLNSDPDDSGIWFKINRVGKNRDTKYTVSKYQTMQKNASGRASYQDDTSPLPDAIVNEYVKYAYDLSSIYQRKSYEDLKKVLIVNLTRIIRDKGLDILKVDGFYIEDAITSAPVATTKEVAKSTKPPVALKLGSMDKESDDDFDILAAAEGILGR